MFRILNSNISLQDTEVIILEAEEKFQFFHEKFALWRRWVKNQELCKFSSFRWTHFRFSTSSGRKFVRVLLLHSPVLPGCDSVIKSIENLKTTFKGIIPNWLSISHLGKETIYHCSWTSQWYWSGRKQASWFVQLSGTSFWFWIRETGMILVQTWWGINRSDQASSSCSSLVSHNLPLQVGSLVLFSIKIKLRNRPKAEHDMHVALSKTSLRNEVLIASRH